MSKTKMTYLSGWEALNIPNKNGITADWHPLLYLADKDNIKRYKYNPILGGKGIEKRYVKMLGSEEYVASFARAIADLVYQDNTVGLKNCVKDFLNDDDELELFNYLKLLPKSQRVENFMKYELTKLYFKDSEC